MDILVIIFFIAAFISLVAIIYLYAVTIRNINKNFDLVAKILDNPNTKSSFFGLRERMEGFYKGRKILFGCYPWRQFGRIRLEIIPHVIPRKKSYVLIFYPRPTKNTCLFDEIISYQVPWYIEFIRFKKPLSEKEIIETLGELTRSAEIVETNAPYYKEQF